MKVNEFIKHTLTLAGVELDDETAATLGASALQDDTLQISQEIFEKFNKGIYSSDAARNNKDLRAHFRKEALDAVDKNLLESIDFLEEDEKSEIEKAENTISKIKTTIQALVKKRNEAPDKAKINDQISKLQSELKQKQDSLTELEEQLKNTETNIRSEYEQKFLRERIKQKIFGFDLTENIPGGKDYLANATVDETFRDYTVRENGDSLQLLNKDGTEVYDEKHQKITLEKHLENKVAPFVKRQPEPAKPKPRDNGNGGSINSGRTYHELLKTMKTN
jgi:hypothetical protein